ncbi:hypothetical protein Tco_1272484 [Tanacetum coccineum]
MGELGNGMGVEGGGNLVGFKEDLDIIWQMASLWTINCVDWKKGDAQVYGIWIAGDEDDNASGVICVLMLSG